MTAEMTDLADRYIAAGIFSRAVSADALHVAAAVLMRHEILLSWNFRHLVNRTRRAAVSAVNIRLGLPAIDIIAPPEL